MSKFSELYFEPHPNWHLPGRKKVPPRGATAVGAVGQNGWVDKPKDKQEVVKQPGWGDVSLDKKRVHGLKHPCERRPPPSPIPPHAPTPLLAALLLAGAPGGAALTPRPPALCSPGLQR